MSQHRLHLDATAQRPARSNATATAVRERQPRSRASLALSTALAVLAALLFGIPAAPTAMAAAGAQDFEVRFTANANGSVTAIGNTLLACRPGSLSDTAVRISCEDAQAATAGSANAKQANNNSFVMDFLNQDPSAPSSNAPNSSASELALPAGSRILWAGLYWGARLSAGSGGQSGQAAQINTMSLRVPGSSEYITINASTAAHDQFGPIASSGNAYQRFADVTSILQGVEANADPAVGANGVYWGANVETSTGEDRYAGWSLVVAFEAPGMPLRNLTVFDGFDLIQQSNSPKEITISGFQAPLSGPVNAELSMVAYEGDVGQAGDTASLNNQQLGTPLSPGSNFFSSSNEIRGENNAGRTPAFANMMGFDVKNTIVTGAIDNGDTEATFSFSSTGDTYFPGVFALAIDVYAPDFTTSTKQVTNVTDPARVTAQVGDILQYTITYRNTGQDDAVNAVASDTIPAGTTFVPGSLVRDGQSLSDAADGDGGFFSGNTTTVTLGNGAGAASGDHSVGGTIPVGGSNTYSFQVEVTDAAAALSALTITNTGTLAYTTATTGTAGNYTTNLVSTPVTPIADLSLAKTFTATPIDAPANSDEAEADDSEADDSENGGEAAAGGDGATDGATDGGGETEDGADAGHEASEPGAPAPGETPGGGLGEDRPTAPDIDGPGIDGPGADDQAPQGDLNVPTPGANLDPEPEPTVTETFELQIEQVAFRPAAARTEVAQAPEAADPTEAAGAPETAHTPEVAHSPEVDGWPAPQPNPLLPWSPSELQGLAASGAVLVGSPLSATLTAHNAGPSPATGVVITDPIPAGWTVTTVPPGCTMDAQTITCTVDTLAAGADASFTIDGVIDPNYSDSTMIVNAARVSSDAVDPDAANNTATALVEIAQPAPPAPVEPPAPVVTAPELQATSAFAVPAVPLGAKARFAVTVANVGDATAPAPVLSSDLPSGVTVNLTDPANAATACTASAGDAAAASAVTCQLPDLDPGDTATVQLVATTDADALSAEVGNTVEVNSVATTSDPATAPASATASAPITVEPGNTDVAISMTGPSTVVAGADATYHVTVTNNNVPGLYDVPATVSTVTVNLPTGASLASAQGATCIGGQTLTCTLDHGPVTLAAGQSVAAGIAVQFQPGLAPNTPLDASASVELAHGTAAHATVTYVDANQENNTATAVAGGTFAPAQAVAVSDTSITKTAVSGAAATPGSNVTWRLTARNAGPSTAHDVTIADPIPAGMSFVSAAIVTGGVPVLCPDPFDASATSREQDRGGDFDAFQTIICTIGTLAPGQTATVDVTLRLNAVGPNNAVCNRAIIGSGSSIDRFTANNVATSCLGGGAPMLPWLPIAPPQHPVTGVAVAALLAAAAATTGGLALLNKRRAA